MKAEEYQERKLEVAGWPVHLVSYRLGPEWHCKTDNISPGATLARITAVTREEAEEKALERTEEVLARTRRHKV